MIYHALYLCLYWHVPNAQDTCHVASPPQILFSHDDCMAYFSHGGFHDSVSDTLRKHFLCGETGGIPGHSLVCSANLTSCKLYNVPAEFPEVQRPIENETGQGE
jgi:hypothetical protein